MAERPERYRGASAVGAGLDRLLAADLPSVLTSFVGRETELATVTERLADRATRLVTLLGPGGVGKTRLAIRLATEVADGFRDGVAFVSLAATPSADLVPEMKSLASAAAAPVGDTAGLIDVVEVARGRAHSCALLRNATVWCWGENSFHQLADGTTERRDRPAMVQGIFGVQQVVAAADGTCVRMGDGDVRCWGNNTHGQLAPQTHPRVVVNVPTSVRH